MAIDINFEDYLKKKKIDPEGFMTGKPEQFAEFKELFGQVHPNSFTTQKLFLLNKIRRAFPYRVPEAEIEKEHLPAKKRPIVRRKVISPKKPE